MRKLAVMVILCALSLTFSCVAFGAESGPLMFLSHGSNADMVDGKAVYDNARFNAIFMLAYEDRPITAEDSNVKGSLTIKNGTFRYYGQLGEKVVEGFYNNQDATFDFIPSFPLIVGSSNQPEYQPSESGVPISFTGTADGGLQGKSIVWSLYNINVSNRSETIPNFRTTPQQLETYIPYVEYVRNGTTVTGIKWRLVKPGDTTKAVLTPQKTSVRIRLTDTDGKRLMNIPSEIFEAGAIPSGVFDIPNSITEGNIRNVEMRIFPYEEGFNPGKEYYRWFFYPRSVSNKGLENDAALSAIETATGGTKEIKFILKESYWKNDAISKLIIGDASVLAYEKWDYNTTTRESTLVLKGLRSGTTTLSIPYTDRNGSNYQTVPVNVTVTGAGSDSSGGSSGCNAGGLGLMALALVFLKKRNF